jgi:hypothetical protein
MPNCMMRRLNTAALSRPLVTVSQLPERAFEDTRNEPVGGKGAERRVAEFRRLGAHEPDAELRARGHFEAEWGVW